jgi:hypothetical protein
MDEIFRLYKKYKAYVRLTAVEASGPFKMFYALMQREQNLRSEYIGLRPILALPDKDAKIRNFIQPLLDRGQIYVTEQIGVHINEEIQTFPGGMKKDMLDAMEIANRYSSRQFDEEDLMDYEGHDDYEKYRKNDGKNKTTGY